MRAYRRIGQAGMALAGILSALAAGDAAAQTDDERAAARAAATEGLKAFQGGRYQDAVDYCKKAEALMHAPTHLLLIARAQTKLGHLVEAQEAYFRITRDAIAPGAPRAFVDAQASAGEEQAALAPRIPTLKVTIDGAPAKDVTLTIDGQTIASAVIGLARPIDPGQHTVAAKSASAESETSTVMVPEGGAQSVTLVMHPVASSGSSPTTEAPVAQGQGEQPSGHTGLRVAGWIGVGVGVVGAALGTVFLMSNHSNLNDANALCGPTVCPASKRDQIDKLDSNAKSAATLSWVSYGVGVAGLGTGVVLLVMSGSKASSPAQTARVTPWVGPTSVGLTGTF